MASGTDDSVVWATQNNHRHFECSVGDTLLFFLSLVHQVRHTCPGAGDESFTQPGDTLQAERTQSLNSPLGLSLAPTTSWQLLIVTKVGAT